MKDDISGEKQNTGDGQRQLLEKLLKEKAGRQRQAVTSCAQQRMWMVNRIEQPNSSYNIPCHMTLKGRLDVDILHKSLNEIIRRHATLRTLFRETEGRPVQVIQPGMTIELPVIDINRADNADWQTKLKTHIEQNITGLFDLEKGPLIRAALYILDNDEHVLLIVMHHIIADGWSVGVLVNDLFKIYQSLYKGDGSELEPLKFQYVDYSLQQSRWIKGEQYNKQLAYWKQHLSGLPSLKLPTDRPRKKVKGYDGATHSFAIDAALSNRLHQLCEQYNVTPYMLLLAVYTILLSRYSGQTDIAVGTPIANRNRANIENLIGFFVNMLVMRNEVSPDLKFTELLSRVSKTTLAAYSNQDIPFEQLVDELQTRRDTSRNPLFQVAFALQNESIKPVVLEDLEVGRPVIPVVDESEYGVKTTTTRFDIELHVWESDKNFRGTWVFDTHLYDSLTITRMQQNFVELLSQVCRYPQRKISELSIPCETELNEILVEWNKTGAPYPRDLTMQQLFEQRVAADPDAVALEYDNRRTSYRELNESANRLAWYLKSRGVVADQPVAVMQDRTSDMVITWLAILKAGGAYVPLDPDYPAARLNWMLKDSGARILVTAGDSVERLSIQGPEVVHIDHDADQINACDQTSPPCVAGAENLAYIIYTSGSTGEPKGVAVAQRAVARLVLNTSYVQPAPHDRIVQASNASFDAATFEVWGALLNGATLVGADKNTTLNPQHYGDFLKQKNISILFVTTALFNQIAREKPDAFSTVQAVMFGGEAVDVNSVQIILQKGRPERLLHVYGPTESTTFATWYEIKDIDPEATTIPIGRAITNSRIYVLDEKMKPVPAGVAGELYIGGDGLAREYWRRAELTAQKFPLNPLDDKKSRLYKTGDLVRWNSHGQIEFIGRIDNQIKLRGFRIELGEIESRLRSIENIADAVVILREDEPGDKRLVAYVIADSDKNISIPEIRDNLHTALPAFMVPAVFVLLDEFPLTPNGKVDRGALPAPAAERQVSAQYVAPDNDLETSIAALWSEVLGVSNVGVDDNFFDLGGHSLLLVQLHKKLQKLLDREIPIVELFQYTTVKSLAAHLAGTDEKIPRQLQQREQDPGATHKADEPVAVIGMSGRFPDARNLSEFWRNLENGVESVRFFTKEELRETGIDESLLNDPDFVAAKGYLQDADMFDAQFFACSPREAKILDPQHRIFLEIAWEALEDAACDPDKAGAKIGVYAGSSENTYWFSILNNAEIRSAGMMENSLASGKDFLATRVAYKLNLHGPAVTVQSACSTSLVAVHEACKSLLNNECDIALAGGVSVSVPLMGGHRYEPNSIASPDGHCRAFDAGAQGTIGADGAGVVVLKRLSRALEDGDVIHAVIRGSAINNDGSAKIGYTAPSVEGQSQVIAAALAAAQVDPATIGYIETHGTGTRLGDPIEVTALNRAFSSVGKQHCIAMGSLKSNFGHLDAAAGVGGLIKTILALKHEKLPPSLNYREANPEINFDDGPFYVNAQLQDWTVEPGALRRAGVSSFGIGGTNAHVVIEQAPERPARDVAQGAQLLLLSARTRTALDSLSASVAGRLEQQPELSLEDVAFTLQTGRRRFKYSRICVSSTVQDAVQQLKAPVSTDIQINEHEQSDRKVAFLFSGQGSQYVNMAADLYKADGFIIFREALDQCCEKLQKHLDKDLREIIFSDDEKQNAAQQLKQTRYAQPALFSIEYALALQWMHWGIKPAAMLGHSIGEYVAACLAGVFSLDDALLLVAHRGRLMDEMQPGGMLSVPLAEQDVADLIDDSISIATINGPAMTVVSGDHEAIDALNQRLQQDGIEARLLHTSHAFHSHMMEPMLDEFGRILENITLHSPELPYISNVTGDWITQAQATRDDYYVQHLRRAVQFSRGIEQLATQADMILLEVGPGQVLTSLAKSHPAIAREQVGFSTTRHPNQAVSDVTCMLETLGRLAAAGVSVNWSTLHAPAAARKVSLPCYPFERQRFWIDPDRSVKTMETFSKQADIGQWFYVPSWQRAPLAPTQQNPAQHCWLMLVDDTGPAAQMAQQLRRQQAEVVCVYSGKDYICTDTGDYIINTQQAQHYEHMLADLAKRNKLPQRIVHGWLAKNIETGNDNRLSHYQDEGFYSLVYLAQALANREIGKIVLTVITSQVHDITGSETIVPDKATVLGPVRVIPREYDLIATRQIDLDHAGNGESSPGLIAQLINEAGSAHIEHPVVGYRGQYRWVQTVDRVALEQATNTDDSNKLRSGGTCLITGGLGGVGLTLADYLARHYRANLVLVGRTELPPRSEWAQYLKQPADDRVAEKIETILTIEQNTGCDILPCAADVTDRNEMQQVIAAATEKFGGINGVIHAAGVAGGGIIQNYTHETVEPVFAPKIAGTLLLDELFRDAGLDFFMVFSSLITFLAIPGRAEYLAANAFVDAFITKKSREQTTPVTVVNWDTWVDAGMAVNTGNTGQPIDADEGISNEEGMEAFTRILNSGLPQVAVSVRTFEPKQIEQIMTRLSSEAVVPVDTDAHPRPEMDSEYVAPATDTEKRLVAIWQQLLGITPIGIHDNFFSLGGDSVISIQVIAQARKAGLNLTPKLTFEHQTIAELAAACDTASPVAQSNEKRIEHAPLTPIQSWFFEQAFDDAHHFNQATMVEVPEKIQEPVLRRALEHLMAQHDALTMRFIEHDNTIKQKTAAGDQPVPLQWLDLSEFDETEQRQQIEALADKLQRSLNLAEGPIIATAYFRLGPLQPDRLLMVIHHLVIDAVSWRILLEDLHTAVQQIKNGEPVNLPAATTSFGWWAQQLNEYAQSSKVEQELDYWRALANSNITPLPEDMPAGNNTMGSVESVTLELDEEQTRSLLQDAPQTYKTRINDLFLTALARVISGWAGQRQIYLDMEGHGRDAPVDNVDISRTVGWFTSVYPVLIQLPEAADTGSEIKSVKEQLRRIPQQGFNYGVLRYLSHKQETRQSLSALPEAQAVFLYLGRFDYGLTGDFLTSDDMGSTGLERSEASRRPHLLEITAVVAHEQLKIIWRYSREKHHRTTIQRLANEYMDTLKQLITHCTDTHAHGFTPSDFPAARIDQSTLDRLAASMGKTGGGQP